MCPQELEQRKRQIEKQQQKVAEKEKQLSARQTELSQSLQKLTQNVELYRERLGLDLQRVDVNQLRFIFIYIDPANPKRQFSVDLYLDDSTDLYRGACTVRPIVTDMTLLTRCLRKQWKTASRPWRASCKWRPRSMLRTATCFRSSLPSGRSSRRAFFAEAISRQLGIQAARCTVSTPSKAARDPSAYRINIFYPRPGACTAHEPCLNERK